MSRVQSLLRALRRPGAEPGVEPGVEPWVAAVVLVTDDNSLFLPDCLASLDQQTRRPDSVLLAVTGRARDTIRQVESVRPVHDVDVLPVPALTDAAAANQAVSESDAQHVLLLTAGDVLTTGAIEHLLDADVDVAGSAGAIPTHPVLYRRAVWEQAALAVPEGPSATFQPQADAILFGATSKGVRHRLTEGPTRGTGRGHATQTVRAPDVATWVAAVRRAREVKGFDLWVLRHEVPLYLDDAERCTPDQWALLSELARDLEGHLAKLPVERRVQAYLAARGRQADLVRLNIARWQEQDFPVRVEAGLTYALLPVDDVPPEILRCAPPKRRPARNEQLLLQQWYREADHEVDQGLVFFQSFHGSVTDHPLAIHDELRRRRPDLRTVWAVASPEIEPPDGAGAVVMRSPEWHAARATAGTLVVNADQEKWFVKRPGQRVVQTYHGYPAKAMGIAEWEAKGFTPLQVERQLRRTSATWDLLLTPIPEMDVHYREQYRYEGEILAAGYPRDDVLVGPEAAAIRERVRKELGVGDRTVVMYAPTWRDDLSTNFRAAPLAKVLDVERAAAELGDDYVLLLRGHRFHRDRGEHSRKGNILDVTDHPEVNDLILASDAAVLDYSSLRFDFSLTRRPMVFLVPDLERFEAARGFLYDYRETAPGPLLEDTDEVIAALRDLPAVAEKYQESYERFHATYNRLQDGHAAERVVRRVFG